MQHHTHIIGGEASVFWNFDYGSAEAIGNMVNLTNVTIATHSSLKNPIIDIFGGLSKDATTDNVVTIKGNTKINWDGSGSASSTKIYIKGGDGYHQSNRNKVYIQDNSKIKAVEIIGGGSSQVASENLVIISGGTINVPIIGGGSATNATNNQVTISGGKVTSSTIYGGNANKSANENKVTITEGTANIADIYGGKSISNNSIANKNSITISGGTLQVTNIYGGHSAKDANENSIQISNGGNINNIVGGHAQDHTNLNTINITGGTIQSVTGGNSGVVASQNYVNVSGGVVENYIIGGKSYSGSATKNSVIVSTDTSAIIIGGQGTNANAIENSVTISGGKVTNSIYGGKSTNGNANKNSVTISGDNTSITDKIYGGEGISASENRIEISNGKISGEIYGGYGTTVSKNSVTISGGTVTSNIYGGKSLNGNSTENSVNISNGTITGNIYGGYAKVASKNVVAISGGTIVGNIYGGYSSGGGSSTGNKIIISGSPDLSNATLYGADGKIAAPPPIEQNLAPKRVRRALADPADIQPLNDPPSDYKSGNTLATQDSLNLKIKSIKNFSNLNLNIPRDMTTNDYILILGEDMDLSDLIITPQFNANNLNLNEGDTITLIGGFDDAKITGGDDANSIIPIPIPAPQPVPVIPAPIPVIPAPIPVIPVPIPVIPAPVVPIVTPIIDPVIPAPIIPAPVVLVSEPKKTLFGVSQIITYTSVGNSKFVLGKKEPNPGMKSFLESGVASIVSTNQAGDLASNEGIKNMVSQASSSNSFAALSNGRFRYKTGSHIDINGFSLIVGVSKEIESFTYGIFMEAGNANYNSYNDFAPNSIPNTNSIKGSGDTNYFGIGVLLNTKLANNFYLDGSLRGGKVKSNYVSNDFNGVASFDMGRNYFGGHIGLGRIFNINDINIIDLYSKILYSEQGSKAVYIRDEGFEFDTAKSIRLSLGARYNYELNDSTNLYGGAAYEREFDGKQKTYSIVANANIDAPGASGDSAMLEIGASITPTNYKAFNANFNLQLFTGVKSGISGGLKARYKF
uniref:hypothetical protein n=1 Tax=Campylobacter fetus TaxID=196 RepID=UPI003AF61F68